MNFPMIDTYEAQVICLFEEYPKEIIQLIKKHKTVLKKNNFNTKFFLKIENRKSHIFNWHIEDLAVSQISKWYRSIRTKDCIRKLVDLKKINPFSNIHIRDYYLENEKVFDFLGLEEDINILLHLFYGDEECENSQGDFNNPNFDQSTFYDTSFDDSIETEYLEDEEEIRRKLVRKNVVYYPLTSCSDKEYSEDFYDYSDEESNEVIEEVVQEESSEEQGCEVSEEELTNEKFEEMEVKVEVPKPLSYYDWLKSFFV